MAGLCAPTAAWSASAPSTACTSAIGRWCATPLRVRATWRAGGRAELRAAAARILRPPTAAAAPHAGRARSSRACATWASTVVGLLRFDAKLCAAMGAEDFVRQLLVGRLRAREVWIGPDFRFGKGRARRPDAAAATGRTNSASARTRSNRCRRRRTRVQHAHPRSAASGDFDHCRAPARSRAMRSAAASCAASNSGARSAFPPPTCAFAKAPAAVAASIATWVHGVGDAPHRLGVELRHAADGRRHRAACSKRTCSISTATCTGAASRSNSSPSCATN